MGKDSKQGSILKKTSCRRVQSDYANDSNSFLPLEVKVQHLILFILDMRSSWSTKTGSDMTITQDLARFITRTDIESIQRDVINHAKMCVLDWLGAAVAGSLEPSTKTVMEMVREFGGRLEATIIGTKLKAPCPNAALANGVMGHAIELDDIHEESVIHPAAPVVPAALACAERKDASGSDLLAAVILGYEVETRIGMAVMPSHYRYWHTTGTCGTFGAAAAAGKILALDMEEMTNALGIAGTQASGLIEVFGTMSKPFNAGRAAMGGVLAALLAERGMTGPETILEGEKGFCRAVSEEPNFEIITERLGERFEITRNIFKLHASCGHTHGAVDAILAIRQRHEFRLEDVEEIRVGTYPIAFEVVGKNYEPKTSSEAKFSLPYCVAVALVEGRVGITEFSPTKLRDPKVFGLAEKVKVDVSPEFRDVRLGGADVTVHLRTGEEYSLRANTPRGYAENPLSKRELVDKFRSSASTLLPEESVDRILEIVDRLDKIENINTLIQLL